MTNFGTQPPNVTFFEVDDRVVDGFYTVGANQIHIHVIDLLPNGQIRVPTAQTIIKQALSIRNWISIKPHGIELFFRFHPGSGGISHLLYDRNITPAPIPEKSALGLSSFSGQTFQFIDILVPLMPRRYFYNIHNLENQPNGYKIAFETPGLDC